MIAPDPVLFTVFGIDIMWYGALIGTGFLLAIAISYYRAPKFGIDRDFILTLTIWIIPSALIGARLYYVIFSWDNYSDDLSKILDVRNGGLAVHGGLILSFTFLYESVWCLLLFIFLMYWSDHRRKFNGQIICLYGILYSAERFLVEGLRTDSLMIGPLRQAQVISLAIIAVCAAIYFILKKQNKSLR